MRDLSVQAANGSLSSTERGYLDAEHAKLATTLGAVIDLAKFNEFDLVNDSGANSITLQSGANAGDTTTISFAAMTETSLTIDATAIDLTKDKAVFTVSAPSMDGGAADNILRIVVDGITYQSANGAVMQTAANMATEFGTADFKSTDGNNTVFNTVFSVAASGTDLVFTAVDTDAKGATMVLSKVSGTDALTAGTTTATTAGAFGLNAIDAALATVASERASLGATQAQLESTVRNLANIAENTSAAAGRIMDTDYAAETANLTKAQILQQAATSVLAQANAQPQAVLSLLQ
jgi:flagellin